jgi:hypothetical protein
MCNDCGGKKDSMDLSTKAGQEELQTAVNELSRIGIQHLTINNYEADQTKPTRGQ